jgi:integrase
LLTTGGYHCQHPLREPTARVGRTRPAWPPARKWRDYDLVFAGPTGEPLPVRTIVKNQFQPTLRRAELPVMMRLYDLRHSCATLLLTAGENPKVVSERLGLASVQLTLDLNSHMIPDMQTRAAERLEALLHGQRTGRHTIGTQEAEG